MPRQKVRKLISAIEQGKVSDDEFAMVKRLVEKRDRDAAHATAAPVDKAQHRSPRSLTPEIPPDVCVSLEEIYEEDRMNPEPTELESPPAGTGLETPGQQCPPERGDIGDRTIHRRRLFSGWHGFESGGRHFSTHGTRWHASRYSYDTGKPIKHRFPEGKPQTRRQRGKQRREQAI